MLSAQNDKKKNIMTEKGQHVVPTQEGAGLERGAPGRDEATAETLGRTGAATTTPLQAADDDAAASGTGGAALQLGGSGSFGGWGVGK